MYLKALNSGLYNVQEPSIHTSERVDRSWQTERTAGVSYYAMSQVKSTTYILCH